MGMLRELEEHDTIATLEYIATGTVTVEGQPCKLTRYRVEINYQMSGMRADFACTRPNGQSHEEIQVVGGGYAWNEIGGPGGGLVSGKGSAVPMMDAYNERAIRLWGNPQGALKSAVMGGANTKVGMEGGKTTVTYPVPGVPGAIATATLTSGPIEGVCTRNCAERVVVRHGNVVTEFIYSNYKDYNDPEEQLDAFFAGRIVEKRGATTVLDLTVTRTNTPNLYIVVPVPPSVRNVAPAARPNRSRNGDKIAGSERRKAMTCRSIRYSVITAFAVAAGLVLAPLAEAQYGAEGAAVRAPQNQTSSVATPRTPDGKPDLSGFWGGGGGGGGAEADAEGNLTVLNRSRGCHPGMKICTAPVNQSNDSTFAGRYDANRPLYKPEYWAKVRELDFNSNTLAPYFKCQPAGVPRMGPPVRILQSKDDVVFLYGQQGPSPTDFRIIPTDGRPHDPIKSQDLLFYGHAVGKWEGDTLVIDSVAFNDITWMGQGGYFHSDQMRVIERFRREGETLHYQATVIDPEALLEPWLMNPRVLRLNTNKNATIAEQNPCEERDLEHMVGRIRH